MEAAAPKASSSLEADVSVVKGVGPVRAKKLRGVGLGTAGELASLKADEYDGVSSSTGVPIKALQACVEDAKRYMDAIKDKG